MMKRIPMKLIRSLGLIIGALTLLGAGTPSQALDRGDEARIATAKPTSRDEIALTMAFRGTGPLPRVARTKPLQVKVGDVETFWVADPATAKNRQIQARLRYVGPHVLMYVDTSLNADQSLVERSAKLFENRIYPRDRLLFGRETSPGIDGDPRLTILNTLIRGAGGYFSPSDRVVRAANRFSNERDMFVIDVGSYPIGSDGYASTLAHEFQHMIHDGRGLSSASWFDEGMSTLAEDLNGYVDSFTTGAYLAQPDLPMLDWSSNGQHYGMSRLFMRYFYEQYASADTLSNLINNDAGNNIDAFAQIAARKRPAIKSFSDLFADWSVATLLNDPQVEKGRYAYRLRPRAPQTQPTSTGTQVGDVAQYGVDYLNLTGPLTLDFDGANTIALVGVRPTEGRFAWWSNRGDQQVATLTRSIDLRTVKQATLQFKAWYALERSYDYAFVSVSTDAGTTWKTLKSTSTTSDDPQGVNFGQGWTGISGAPQADIDQRQQARWLDEQADLSAYAGRQVLLRFWLTTDAAINGPGMLIDDLRIPEIGLRDGFEQESNVWTAAGFVRVVGELPQHWSLRLVRYGAKTSVEPVAVDPTGHAQIKLAAGEKGVLVVSGTTRYTSEHATYTYTIR
jgi:hypothetical protein